MAYLVLLMKSKRERVCRQVDGERDLGRGREKPKTSFLEEGERQIEAASSPGVTTTSII